MPTLAAAVPIITGVIGAGTAIAGLAKGAPKQTSGTILPPIQANTDLAAAPGVQHNPVTNALQMPSLNLGNFGQNKPSFQLGGNLNSDLLKTLGSMGGF